MRRNGFTMIEFLVVAVLIGILATLGFGAYSRSLSRGRDAKRVSDMQSAQKTFEMYYSVNSHYDVCETMLDGVTLIPPNGNLDYFGNCTLNDYVYCSGLENGTEYGNYICDPPTDTTNCNPETFKPTHFCVTNVQ